MKHTFTYVILIAALVGCIYTANAQRFKGEIIAGCNFSQVDGDMVVGYKKVSPKAGLGAMLPFSWSKYNEDKRWAVSMEILYNQKGAREKQYDYNIDTADPVYGVKFKYNLTLHYVSVPVMLHYYDRNIWSIGIGFQYSRLVNYKEIEYDWQRTAYSTHPDSAQKLRSNDVSAIVDIRCRIWQQLKVGFRFEYSINSMRTRHFRATTYYDEQTRQQRNNSLSLYLVYMINEKKTDKIKSLKATDRTYYY